ncbi:MAG: AAA family ATPase [Gammaproteobacteria bacterium]|nr:AAA family ATPase [Gammaproteobacteria bacterium]
MYCELFQLNEPPFRLTPDPQFLFASKQHARAKAYMESTIWLADGFVVITGDIGSGKTTLIESFLAELGDDVVLAHVNQTQLSPVEFLQALLVEFGYKPFRMRKIELLSMLKDFMVEQYAAGKKVLLVVDEAQNLSRKVLEEIRLLSGIEAQKEKLLRIIFAGQPELSRKLDSPRLEQLMQRVRLRFHLSALSKRETREYILHRLEVAGAAGRTIFEEDAFDVIFRYSGGVPRLTNILCDTAMLCAFTEEKRTVDAGLVMTAVEELQWVEYAQRVRERERSASMTGRFPVPGAATPAGVDLYFHNQFVAHFELPPGRAIIGRTPDNDVQVRSKFISRHHAQIVTDRGQSVIEDLNSTNGIFVGSRRVKHHTLADGDIVQVGDHTIVFRAARPATAEHEGFTETDTALDDDADDFDEEDDADAAENRAEDDGDADGDEDDGEGRGADLADDLDEEETGGALAQSRD